MDFLFFSAEAKAPAGKILMNLICPIETEFNQKFSSKYSSDKLINITIVFICTDEEMYSQGFYKERRYISWKNKYADIRLRIPYSEFIKADYNTRKKKVWEVIEMALDYLKNKKALQSINAFITDLRTLYWSDII